MHSQFQVDLAEFRTQKNYMTLNYVETQDYHLYSKEIGFNYLNLDKYLPEFHSKNGSNKKYLPITYDKEVDPKGEHVDVLFQANFYLNE
jgi:hypothetical protein